LRCVRVRCTDGNTREQGGTVHDALRVFLVAVRCIHGDKGYRGHTYPDRFKVWISGQVRRVTKAIRREMRRRAAVEPVIGHLKDGHRMRRNYLKGRDGDRVNAAISAAGYDFSLFRRWFEDLLCILLSIFRHSRTTPRSACLAQTFFTDDDLAPLADAMHLRQHLIVLLHIRFESLLVKATASAASAHSTSGWCREALHKLHSRLRASMKFRVEAFECVRTLPHLRLIGIIELDHYDVFGRGPFPIPIYWFVRVHRHAAAERRLCGHQIAQGAFKRLDISNLRNSDQNIGRRQQSPARVHAVALVTAETTHPVHMAAAGHCGRNIGEI